MENLTRLSSPAAGYFGGRLNWKLLMMALVVLFAVLAVVYNYNEELLVHKNVLQGKVQRLNE
ncbi:ORF140 [Spodoptera frugiperda granulovirus]|nr:ORF140 [Spodoptera frugiperda granulovirus]AJK91801.1 ORF140 [Spodoptera frugiperda granulovirus]